MQSHGKLEISVGLFVLAGFAALAYMSLTLGGLTLREDRYPVMARFSSVGDLKLGDAVKLAGVGVGEVTQISLVGFSAEVELSVRRPLELPADTIASIQTAGLLGDAYVSLSPGASNENLSPGGKISRTEPAVTISEILAKYAFGSPTSDAPQSPAPNVVDPLELDAGLP